MKISVCVDALWPHLSCEAAIVKAAENGAEAVEFWSWWDKDLSAVKAACKKNGVKVAALCTRFFSLVDQSQHEAYLRGLDETIQVADMLSCHTIISQVGNEQTGMSREEQRRNLVEGLDKSTLLLSGHDIQLVIEPLNTQIDHKGYYLYSSCEAAQIVQEVSSPQVKMLFDIYHQQVMEGDILRHIRQHFPHIGHMHCAGVPGRGPLAKSELDYDYIFGAIEKMGYKEYMGLELFTGTPEMEIQKWCSRTIVTGHKA